MIVYLSGTIYRLEWVAGPYPYFQKRHGVEHKMGLGRKGRMYFCSFSNVQKLNTSRCFWSHVLGGCVENYKENYQTVLDSLR